jgi:predicted alpha/beta hydrolase family esterase
MAIRGCAAAFAAALCFSCASVSDADAACSAFGNPPQTFSAALTAASYALTHCQNGAMLKAYTDANGTPRQACFWDNPAATSATPLPLVVYLQASLVALDTQIGKTGLLAARLAADLSGDAAKPGFLLLAPLPRYTRHYYPLPNNFSLGFDIWYRQFGNAARSVDGIRYPANVDFVTIDHYIAQLTATQRVDAKRIYLVGYSNGASTAIEYAQNRANIAAAAVYSAPDPYAFLSDPCAQQPVAAAPASNAELQVMRRDAPIFHLHRDCDVYGSCASAQRMHERINGSGTAQLLTQTIDRDQQPVTQCDAACGSDPDGSPWNLKARTTGSHNHNTWPGDWDNRLLGYLRGHPLALPAVATP